MLVRAILVILVIFAIYAVYNDPTTAADSVSNLWGHVEDGISSIGTFFDSLLSR